MGLDITAYRQITEAPDAELEDGYPVDWENVKVFHLNDDFSGRAEDVKSEMPYTFAEAMQFRAGSYSGYGQWRRWLAGLVGTTPQKVWEDEPEDLPFLELINFSDCEGTLGAATCAKLAADFASITPRGDEWNVALYRQWQAAFEMAADGGCVEFH